MPVWKPNAAWLCTAVQSVLAEHGCSLELVVVDNGNEEPIASLLSDVSDPRLVLVRIPHGGVSTARNAGIRRATGRAFRFVDADDVAEPGSTAHLLLLSGPDRSIAYGSTLVCGPDLEPREVLEATIQGPALEECLRGRFYVNILSLLFPREVVEAAGGFDPDFEINEDYDFVLRALEHAPVRGERFIATRYRRHGASLTAGAYAGRKFDLLALDKLFEHRADLRGSRLARIARSNAYRNAARQLVLVGRYREAGRDLVAALGLDPLRTLPAALSIGAGLARKAPRAGRRVWKRRPRVSP